MSDLISIIVPVYNEAATVKQVIDRLLEIELPVPRQIIVVDDGSTDGTGDILDGLPARHGTLSIVHSRANGGKGSAVRVGLGHARGTIVAIQDADLELDPIQLAGLIAPILRGETKVVYGSRFLEGKPHAPWLTVAANRFLTAVTNLLYGAHLTDMETCYKVMTADVARGLRLESNRFDIEPEITAKLLRAGHRILERPIRFEPRARVQGKKIGWRDGARALVVLLKYREMGASALPGRVAAVVALAAAITVGVVGIARGTWAVGGSDSSCYALMAQAFAAGHSQPSSLMAAEVPWPNGSLTLAPAGFVPSPTRPGAASPVCAPGFSLLLAPLVRLGGVNGIFLLTPLAGAALVWLAFVLGRRLEGALAGVMAALFVAASPIVLFQVVQPMNDVTTAALWLAVVVAAAGESRHRVWIAGALSGVALMVRPNLSPLAIVAACIVPALGASAERGFLAWVRRLMRFGVAALPGVLAVAWLNTELYGSPLRSGYGDVGFLFNLAFVPTNAARYLRWLVETHTPIPLLGLAAPLICSRTSRGVAGLAVAMAAATVGLYLLYRPFDEWWYLRFLLPAIVLCLVLASAVIVRLCSRLPGPAAWGLAAALALGVGLFGVRTSNDRLVFQLQAQEQRFRDVGLVVRDRLPDEAALLTVWHSGGARFYAGKEAVLWDSLDPLWLDRAVSWLNERNLRPYIILESWEEPEFRARFSGHAVLGDLDWPPAYEVDRLVRIFDPADRARYLAGEPTITQYLWPSNPKEKGAGR